MVIPPARTREFVDAVRLEKEVLPLDVAGAGQSSPPSAGRERNGRHRVSEYIPRLQTRAEREAKKALRKVEAEQAMHDHAKAQMAFDRNRERLKAERLRRETFSD